MYLNISCGSPFPGVSQSLGQRDAQDTPISLSMQGLSAVFPHASFRNNYRWSSLAQIKGVHRDISARARIHALIVPIRLLVFSILSFRFPNNSFFYFPFIF